MDAFTRLARHINTSRGYGAGGEHADEMLAEDRKRHNPFREIVEARRRTRVMLFKVAMVFAAVLLAAWAITGCAATPRPSKCPPVKEYDEEFTAAFKAQLIARDDAGLRIIPEGSPVAVYILDADQLRKQVRKCN